MRKSKKPNTGSFSTISAFFNSLSAFGNEHSVALKNQKEGDHFRFTNAVLAKNIPLLMTKGLHVVQTGTMFELLILIAVLQGICQEFPAQKKQVLLPLIKVIEHRITEKGTPADKATLEAILS